MVFRRGSRNLRHRPGRPPAGLGLTGKMTSAERVKRIAAFVGLLGACVGSAAGIKGFFPTPTLGPLAKLCADEQIKIVKRDDAQFEFQLAFALDNEGGKAATIRRPAVEFLSDRPIVEYSPAVFRDKTGGDPFPLVLRESSQVSLTCIIRWKPLEGYDKWTSEQAAGAAGAVAAVTARIRLTWPGKPEWNMEKPFALLAAETIRELKPGDERPIYYLYGVSDERAGAARSPQPLSSGFSRQSTVFTVASIDLKSVADLLLVRSLTGASRETNTRNAKPGEIASGKEVPSQVSGAVTVNIRPCGGQPELVVFTPQFKKRTLGVLPCGVQLVQVEKL